MSDNVGQTEVGLARRELAKRIAGILLTVLLYVFMAICVLAVVIVIAGRRDSDGAVTVFGHQMRTVLTGSMEKSEYTDVSKYEIGSISVDSMVFIETVPEDRREAEKWYSELEVGDVLTFRYLYSTQETITHRIVSKEKVDGGYKITLMGDNKSSEYGTMTQVIDTSVDRGEATNYIIGKVVGVSKALGWFITAIRQPVGMIFMVILPCVAIIALEVVRIFGIFGEEKRRRLGDERKQQDERIAELERMLAEMSAEKSRTDGKDGKNRSDN